MTSNTPSPSTSPRKSSLALRPICGCLTSLTADSSFHGTSLPLPAGSRPTASLRWAIRVYPVKSVPPSCINMAFGISLPGNVFHRLVNGNPVPPVTFHALLRVPSHFTRSDGRLQFQPSLLKFPDLAVPHRPGALRTPSALFAEGFTLHNAAYPHRSLLFSGRSSLFFGSSDRPDCFHTCRFERQFGIG